MRLKLLGLLSWVGGPLYLADLLKPVWGFKSAFVVSFLPVAAMLLAALTLLDEEPTPFARFVVATGALGALALVGMNLFAAVQLLEGHPYKDASLVWVGIGVGCLSTGLFCARARAWWPE